MILQRKVLGVLGFIMPVLVGLFALVSGETFVPSISSTHYMNTYLLFEALMIAIAIFLLTYKGYDTLDYWLSTLAGIGAAGTAIFPTDPTGLSVVPELLNRNLFFIPYEITAILHIFFVAIFFTSSSALVLFQFTKGDNIQNAQKRKRNIVYYICGGLMIASLLLIVFQSFMPFQWYPFGKIFIFELIAVLSFATAWSTKAGLFYRDIYREY